MKHTTDVRREGAKKGNVSESLGSNSEIGRKLKQYYDGLISEDVPDRFTDLLTQLAKKDDEETVSGKD